MISAANERALWGDLFEVAVKRGSIACLLDQELLGEDHPLFEESAGRVSALHKHALRQLEAVDEHYARMIESTVDHLLRMGYGLGYTHLREYLKSIGHPLRQEGDAPSSRGWRKRYELQALWCPYELLDRRQIADEFAWDAWSGESDHEPVVRRFWCAFGLRDSPDVLRYTCKGQPVRADFLALLRGPKGQHRLLCLEISMNAPQIADYRESATHLSEVGRFARLMDRRGVFSRISAEVSGEAFTVSEGLVDHLAALSSGDKPLYKLFQGSSYAANLVDLLRDHDRLEGNVTVNVIALTNNGAEGAVAEFRQAGERDVRETMLRTFGETYRQGIRPNENDPEAYTREIRAVFHQIRRSLPKGLQRGLRELLADPLIGEDFRARFSEEVEQFLNPNDPIERETCLGWVDDTPELQSYFGGSARTAIEQALDKLGYTQERISLRQLHEAAGVAGFLNAKQGALTVLLMEGHPGIGKTTASVKTLKSFWGDYLKIYVSPRIVINSDVTEKFVYVKDRQDSRKIEDSITLTSNSRLIGHARHYYREQYPDAGKRHINGAVIAEGDDSLNRPDTDILCLSADEAERLVEDSMDSGHFKHDVSERQGWMEKKVNAGVVLTLATMARHFFANNDRLRKMVMTLAIQAYKKLDQQVGRSTIDAFSKIFRHHNPHTSQGLAERQAFSRRISNIIVMIDEIAGDAEGVAFIHAMTGWLEDNFIRPFKDNGLESPFRIILVLADASLGNEMVMSRYLESEADSPGKMLLSALERRRPFRMAASPVKLDGRSRQGLHILADSFPAGKLTLDYSLHLQILEQEHAGERFADKLVRKIIREKAGDSLVDSAIDEIEAALAGIEPGQQVIFFAQDKLYLQTIRNKLLSQAKDEHNPSRRLLPEEVAILDGKTPPQARKRLISPEIRDRVKVFLMTSSGSRGVSFPIATRIIAQVPRFSVESGLMEIIQLIYRGRGFYRDADGEDKSGDHLDRKLTMLITDFLVADEGIDERLWARKAIDTLSLLTLIRCSIYTRLRGDAGMPGQPFAAIPVGPLGEEGLETCMSEYLYEFLREATVLKIKHHADMDSYGLMDTSLKLATELFSDLTWKVTQKNHTASTLAKPSTAMDYAARVTQRSARVMGREGFFRIPDTLYCIGPVWLEDLGITDTQESFAFQMWHAATDQNRQKLLTLLDLISKDQRFSWEIKRSALVLRKILYQEVQGTKTTYEVEKEIKAKRKWALYPVDFQHFSLQFDEENLKVVPKSYDDHEMWLARLKACVPSGLSMDLSPIIGRYKSYPFVVAIGNGDITGTMRLFDSRKFLASAELNLLNAILFAREDTG